MAELKTKATTASAEAFLNQIKDDATRQDCLAIAKLMKQASRAAPQMWGANIVGFGSRRLKYASGREIDWMVIGLSPRQGKITLYLPGGVEQQTARLKKLGKHTTGKGCLYLKTLKDVDTQVLKELIIQAVRTTTESAA